MKFSKLLAATAIVAASVLAFVEPGVAQVRHGGGHGGGHVGGHGGGHGGYHGGHNNVNMNVNRNVNRNVNVNRHVGGVGYHGGVYRGAWVGRPYRWAPGGAIAAGAAMGVLAAPAGPVLVLHGSQPAERLLGHLPVSLPWGTAKREPPVAFAGCGCF